MARHDIAVVGASAGGVEALVALSKGLPGDLASAVFVVMHMPSNAESMLPHILERATSLKVTQARNGQTIEEGHMYVCPPNHHLLFADESIRLSVGPKENGHRPAVDAMFRSAAEVYGNRVASVVLSGMLDDGTNGSADVRRMGGVVIAQTPADALFPSMPRNVIETVGADYVLPANKIGSLLGRLAQNGSTPPAANEESMGGNSVSGDGIKRDGNPQPGTVSAFTCPDCGGTLWELNTEGALGFRCRVGHAFSPESMFDAQNESLEDVLWVALRTLEEKIAFAKRLRDRARRLGQRLAEERFARDIAVTERRAGLLRQALSGGESITSPPAMEQSGQVYEVN